MSTAVEAFKRELYAEHLEEASALYLLRTSLLAEPFRAWRSLFDFEARLEAHVDALVIGSGLALDVCRTHMTEGDAGELFAAVSVACRTEQSSLFAEMWRSLDMGDAERVRAATDALRFELPATWTASIFQAMKTADHRRIPMLAAVATYRGLQVGAELAARLGQRETNDLDVASVRALGWLRGPGAIPVLERALRSDHQDVRAAALVGLLLAGEGHTVREVYVVAQSAGWPHLAMGLAGDRQAANILRQQVEAGRASPQTNVALALLGDVTVVRTLVAALEEEPLADTAALALHWITGASLYEDAFVAEAVDEAELFEVEKQAWEQHGAVPLRADGRPYGSEIRQLTRDRTRWAEWLRQNSGRFDANIRYRLGQPYSPEAVLGSLVADDAPRPFRQLAYEELVLRYGCDVPFDAEGRVVDQIASLRRMSRWLSEQGPQFASSAGTFVIGRA